MVTNSLAQQLKQQILQRAHLPERLLRDLPELLAEYVGPRVDRFEPIEGHPGALIEIEGSNFSSTRASNVVTVGGVPGYVVEASPTRLKVITGVTTRTGPVKVQVGGNTAAGPIDFSTLPFPRSRDGRDGPPIFYEGRGVPTPGAGGAPAAGVSAQGTVRSLVVFCNAADTVPANPAATRTASINEFDHAKSYYSEVSYGDTDLQIDYTNWVGLTGDFDDYVDATIANISNPDGITRICAEAAQGAIDQGFDLEDYTYMAVVLFLNGGFIRAWGGWSQENFAFNDGTTNINITVSHPIGLTTIGENADWGRFAHELAHSLVDAGAVLGEDVYSSDLIDGSVANAQSFDLMGSHDTHPMFSGHFMRQLEYYDAANIVDLNWDRNPFSQTFTLVAHGTTQNTDPNRKHLLRITVGSGLHYYVEVRQRMDPASAHFDTNIPVGATTEEGGILVTKVFTDQVNNNQEMRFVTLLHDPVVQDVGAVIEDPERALTITVDSIVSTSPLAFSVTIAWAQVIADDVNGTFDLRLTQTSVPWVSDDIWVDRQPWGITNETDGNGHIVATREKPRPGEINRLFGQVFNSGPDDASNVKLTFYAITPPGVGDNGAWSPIASKSLAAVAGSAAQSDFVNWTPVVGEHTCLKVHASAQFGEITSSNNHAQENVFYFAPPASSPPEPVQMQVAVRNPLERETAIRLTTLRVPMGYVVHVPHSWVIVPPLGERRIEFTIVPYLDLATYREKFKWRSAEIQLRGWVPREYALEVDHTGIPAFTHRAIGGITANVTPKHRAEITIQKDRKDTRGVAIEGEVKPALADQKVTIRVRQVGGERSYHEVKTQSGGRFRFSLAQAKAQPENAKPWATHETRPHPSIYEVRAETFDARDLAAACSNTLYFDLRKKEVTKPAAPCEVELTHKDVIDSRAALPRGRTSVERTPASERAGAAPSSDGKRATARAVTTPSRDADTNSKSAE